MTGQIPADRKVLARLFSNRNIPTDQIAFYNSPAFLAAEQADPAFLEFYGAWVRSCPRDAAYDAHVRAIVPRMAEMSPTRLSATASSASASMPR